MKLKWPLRILAAVAVLIVAVNVAWYGIPFLHESGALRPLGAILVVVVASAAWAKASHG